MNLVSIGGTGKLRKLVESKGKVLLVKPPYFSPWTPPLGIAILKSFLEPHGYPVRCYDFNSDPDLWGMHHKYFSVLQTLEDVSINDGYSKLWWILDAHMLAYANGADAEACATVLASVVPLQGMRISQEVIHALLPLVENFYKRMNDLTEQFNVSEYSVVGTSSYTTSLGPSLFFLKKVKEQYPHIKTIMGGGAFADDLALGSDNLDTLIRNYDFVDHFILGEGELLLLKLLQGEFAGKRVISIADLKGATLPMGEVPIPDFSDVGTENYFHLTIEGARSCPFQCSFCSETIQWGDYRKRPMSSFADQVIELAQQYKNKSFFMGDSLMNPYINQFAGQLLERNADVLYDGYLRADKPVTNRGFVKMWADSGCYRVRLGIESAASRVLDAMDKMTTPQVISDVLKTLASAGIRTTTYWITGFTGETEADFQETLEFIREHHRYIYELEAHAYYYYPYGQIGSRLHQCHSLYPDSVTDIIKFKVWEIDNANPSRVERFNRLRRVSELASDLGLPNIYTMNDRFAAEERWHRLYPLALEVYDGTRLHRKLPQFSGEPIAVFDTSRYEDDAVAAILCYRVTVKGTLDEAVLAAAVEQVVRYNDVLQLRLQDDQYLTSSSDDLSPVEMTSSVTPSEEEKINLPDFMDQTIERIAAQMSPAPNNSLRVVVVRNGDLSEVLLLAHRAIADGRSITFFCEDLFRIYEQLLNKRELSLCPVKKTYTELMQEVEETISETSVGPVTQDAALESETISLDKKLLKKLFSETLKESDLAPLEVITMTLLRSLSKVSNGAEQSIDITADYRSIDDSLDHTAGPLTRIYELPSNFEGGALASLSRMRKILKDFVPGKLEPAPRRNVDERRVLLNLEFFIAEPWVGGDVWTARGFVQPRGRMHRGYLLEIVPLVSRDGIEVIFNYRNTESVRRLVESIKGRVGQEFDSALNDCHRYAAAKKFWLSEFKKSSPAANIEILADIRDGSLEAGWDAMPSGIEPVLLEEVSRKCGVDTTSTILSALGILITRLNGREDALVLTSTGESTNRCWAPIKLNVAWDSSFASLARQVSDSLAVAQLNGAYALEILLDDLTGAKPIFDVAYVERNEQDVVDNLKSDFPLVAQQLKLILEREDSKAGLNVQLRLRKGDQTQALLKTLTSHLKPILEQAADNVNIRLGDMKLDEENEISVVPDLLVQEVFSFGAT